MIRQLYILLLLLLVGIHALGQKMPQDYFEEAQDHQRYNTDNSNTPQLKYHDSVALENYMHIVTKHPANNLCPGAYMGIAGIYERQGRLADAMNIYREVVAIAIAAKKSSTLHYIPPEGNRAARSLCDFHEQNGNYDSALYFLNMYDTLLPGAMGCGVGENEAAVMRYVDFYVKVHRIRDAEEKLLSNSNLGAFEFEPMKEKLHELFKKYEQPQHLKAEIEKGIKNYTLDTVYAQYGNRHDTTVICSLNFLGFKVGSSYRYLVTHESGYYSGTPMPALVERKKMIALLRRSQLYKMIWAL